MTRLAASQRYSDLSRAGSRLTEDLLRQHASRGGEVLNVTAHPAYPLPEHVVEAVTGAARETICAPSEGMAALREAIAEKLTEELGKEVRGEEILVTNGAMHALHVIFLTLLGAGDEVVTPAPCFFFDGIVALSDARLRYHRTHPADGYAWNLNTLEDSLRPASKMLLINSPTNPTGYVCTPQDLRLAADIAVEHDLYLVSDESYDRFVYDGGTHHTPASLSGIEERSVLVRSFTKSFAMPGWRVGYIYAHQKLIQKFTHVLEWINLYTNHIAQAAALAAIAGPQTWLSQLRSELEANRDLLWSRLSVQNLIETQKPGGGPFFLVAAPGIMDANPALDVAVRLASDYGIPATAGSVFSAPDTVRIPFGGELEDVARLADRIDAAFHDLAEEVSMPGR